MVWSGDLLAADDQSPAIQCDGRDRDRRDEDGGGLQQADHSTRELKKKKFNF